MAPDVHTDLRKTDPSTTDATTVATTRGVRRDFDGDVVLDGIDLDLRRGEIVALVGRSGSGKSTLLRILAGLDVGHTGAVEVTGTRAVAFQEPRLLPWKRVRDNVALGVGRDGPARARTALAEVGLSHRETAWPLTLSGGEAQRASLARALVRRPDLLLLDEPFGALDALTRLGAHELLDRLWREHGFAVLLVTHDVEEAVLLSDRVLVLDGDDGAGGRIAHDIAVDVQRPRHRSDAALVALRETILTHLGVFE